MKKFEKKTVYIYEINGQEKITITSPEEAHRWDEIFETAERLDTLLQDIPAELKLDESQRVDLCIYLAEKKTGLIKALGKSSPDTDQSDAPAQDSTDKETAVETKETTAETKKEDGMRKQSFVQEFKRPVPPSKDGFSL